MIFRRGLAVLAFCVPYHSVNADPIAWLDACFETQVQMAVGKTMRDLLDRDFCEVKMLDYCDATSDPKQCYSKISEASDARTDRIFQKFPASSDVPEDMKELYQTRLSSLALLSDNGACSVLTRPWACDATVSLLRFDTARSVLSMVADFEEKK